MKLSASLTRSAWMVKTNQNSIILGWSWLKNKTSKSIDASWQQMGMDHFIYMRVIRSKKTFNVKRQDTGGYSRVTPFSVVIYCSAKLTSVQKHHFRHHPCGLWLHQDVHTEWVHHARFLALKTLYVKRRNLLASVSTKTYMLTTPIHPSSKRCFTFVLHLHVHWARHTHTRFFAAKTLYVQVASACTKMCMLSTPMHDALHQKDALSPFLIGECFFAKLVGSIRRS